MRNCEDVDLSTKDVKAFGPGVTGAQAGDVDEESDPPKATHQCFGRFRWLYGYRKNVKCERCAYFGRCYIETVFKGGR